MNFNIELTEFPSEIHTAIYSKGRGIMPLSRTLNVVSDPDLKKSCVSFHGFVTDMLSDMYDHPEAYHLPVMKLEKFLDGRDINEVKHELPRKVKSIYAQVRHAAITYIALLSRIGSGGKIEDDAIVVSAEGLQYINKRVSSSTSPITLDKRLEGLSRVGFIMEALPTSEYRFTSKNYPDMFLAMQSLPWDNFEMLDFRNINSKYKPTYDDFFYPLITEQRERTYELHNFAMERKMRTSTNANWGVIYHYKSKQVMIIGTGDDVKRFLSVNVVGKDKTETPMIIDTHLGKESLNFQKRALGHMSGCDANRCLMCSSYSSGYYVTVLGKRHQMCGENKISYDWYEPEEADMAMIKRLIEIRCEIIDEAKATKK